MVCAYCRNKLNKDDVYCSRCGTEAGPGRRELTAARMSTEQRGLLVTGLLFVGLYIGSAYYKWKAPKWPDTKSLSMWMDVVWTNVPVLLALYSKGRARTLLLMAGMLLTMYFIVTTFIM